MLRQEEAFLKREPGQTGQSSESMAIPRQPLQEVVFQGPPLGGLLPTLKVMLRIKARSLPPVAKQVTHNCPMKKTYAQSHLFIEVTSLVPTSQILIQETSSHAHAPETAAPKSIASTRTRHNVCLCCLLRDIRLCWTGSGAEWTMQNMMSQMRGPTCSLQLPPCVGSVLHPCVQCVFLRQLPGALCTR